MHLLPQPKSLNLTEGFYTLNYSGQIRLDDSCLKAIKESKFYASLLKEEIMERTGCDYSITTATVLSAATNNKGSILLSLEKETDTTDATSQSYTLTITPDLIYITGFGLPGLLYGVQTLRQIIRNHGAVLPCLTIEDSPAICNRGFYQDISRGRIPTLEQLKKLADTCSLYKINQLQLYVETSYLFEGHSETYREDTPLTAEEILEFDDYCNALQIELVPSLSSFGHLYGLLRTKQFRHLCELEVEDGPFYLTERMEHHTIDPTQEESFELIKNRILDYMKLFRSDKFNICADETFDLGKGKNKETAEQKGTTAIYLEFLDKLCKVVTDAGKIPMFWGDVILTSPEEINRLPEGTICLNWEYDPNVKEENTRTFVEAGAKHLYVCPGVQSWHDCINRHHNAYLNISGMCKLGHKYQVEGVLNTCWGDFGHMAHFEFATIGLLYGAAFSWSDKEQTEDEINATISVLEYGDRTGQVVSLFSKLSEVQNIPWWNIVAYKECQQKQMRLDEAIGLFLIDENKYKENRMKRAELEVQLTAHLASVNGSSNKAKAVAYLLMSKGQTLLEETALCVLEDKMNPTKVAEPRNTLACALEDWLMEYKKLWRSTCKESELFRITDVICYYADYLRSH